MVYFDVPDMYSTRSVGAIAKSVKAFDHEATVIIDMVEHLVAVESDRLPPETMERAIGAAGFTPRIRSAEASVDVLLPLEGLSSAARP